MSEREPIYQNLNLTSIKTNVGIQQEFENMPTEVCTSM